MDKPLTKWYCDVCGEAIDDVEKAYVVWKRSKEVRAHSFKIIHKVDCDLRDHSSSMPLSHFLGSRGLAYLLSMLSIGPIKKLISGESYCQVGELDEFVDFIRRVQTPFYEEARQFFQDEDVLDDFSDANEALPYFPEKLEKMVSRQHSE